MPLGVAVWSRMYNHWVSNKVGHLPRYIAWKMRTKMTAFVKHSCFFFRYTSILFIVLHTHRLHTFYLFTYLQAELTSAMYHVKYSEKEQRNLWEDCDLSKISVSIYFLKSHSFLMSCVQVSKYTDCVSKMWCIVKTTRVEGLPFVFAIHCLFALPNCYSTVLPIPGLEKWRIWFFCSFSRPPYKSDCLSEDSFILRWSSHVSAVLCLLLDIIDPSVFLFLTANG